MVRIILRQCCCIANHYPKPSRRLERETQRNIELMWLTGCLMPDFKAIADFHKNNGKAIRTVCREFIVQFRQLNLFAEAIVAIDGSAKEIRSYKLYRIHVSNETVDFEAKVKNNEPDYYETIAITGKATNDNIIKVYQARDYWVAQKSKTEFGKS